MIALLLSLWTVSPVVAQSPPAPAVQAAVTPEFSGQVLPLNEADRSRMTGVSWRDGCPTPLDALRKLTFSHWTSEGTPATGELIIAASAAEEVLSVFRALYAAKFPVHSAKTIDAYNGSDDASMAMMTACAGSVPLVPLVSCCASFRSLFSFHTLRAPGRLSLSRVHYRRPQTPWVED